MLDCRVDGTTPSCSLQPPAFLAASRPEKALASIGDNRGRTSPDAAIVGRHHRLSDFAPECLTELRHILHHTIHTKLPRRVRIGLHLHPKLLRTRISAPVLTVSEKEFLKRSVAVRLFLSEVDVLSLGVFQESKISEAQASVIRSVFAQGQLPIDFRVVDRGKAAVLVHLTVGFLLEPLGVLGCPPIGEVSVRVKLASLVVKAVSEFMPHNCPDVAVIFRIVCVGIKKGG